MLLIKFTSHALARMAERGVSADQVRRVLVNPLRTLPATLGREEVQGLIERDGRSLLLRVILDRGAVLTIITVIATSKIDKYGGGP
jgi:hypothetical protein